MELLDDVTKRPILFRLERRRRDQADQVIINAIGRIRGRLLERGRLGDFEFWSMDHCRLDGRRCPTQLKGTITLRLLSARKNLLIA
jgi:hypothetical protein